MKNIKRKAFAAVGVAAAVSLAIATPSLALNNAKNGKAANAASSNSASKVSGSVATVAATVTAVPSTITDAHQAGHGGEFKVYLLDAAATNAPATAPTTGAKLMHVKADTLTGGTATGNIMLRGGAASTTTKYAVYPAAGGTGVLVTVTVDAAGVATASSSAPLTVAYATPTAPVAGEGKGKGRGPHGDGRGERGERGGRGGESRGGFDGQRPGQAAPISATVNVPADGKTYTIRITETVDDGVAVTNPVARPGLPVTGTGAQKVNLRLGATDSYKIELVAADGTVAGTVTVTVAADGTVATPIVLG
jgi:hypothetical protein